MLPFYKALDRVNHTSRAACATAQYSEIDAPTVSLYPIIVKMRAANRICRFLFYAHHHLQQHVTDRKVPPTPPLRTGGVGGVTGGNISRAQLVSPHCGYGPVILKRNSSNVEKYEW